MVQKEDTMVKLDNGMMAKATFPVVVSASRSTDIPAFYADWFFHRLKVGYSAWTNPFNGIKSYVSYANTKFIVFWSKNPRPLLNHLDELQEKGIGCYIQYTLNDYEEEGLERGVPPLTERIETFKMLVQRLGKGAVVWRFDPLILTDRIDIDKLLRKIENIGDQLIGYTEKLVFSFADIISYRKVKANLEKNHINYIDWTQEQMIEFANRLVKLNKEKGWNYTLATCGEAADLQGIEHNHCVDDRLIVRFGYKSPELMRFLGAECCQPTLFEPLPEDAIKLADGRYVQIKKDNRDKGQRIACGCMKSKDIGEYNTCPHLCEYCYANSSKDIAVNNWRQHKLNPLQDTITGK
jgi:DNA repair photolyase